MPSDGLEDAGGGAGSRSVVDRSPKEILLDLAVHTTGKDERDGNVAGSSFIKTIPAVSIATSVPAPIGDADRRRRQRRCVVYHRPQPMAARRPCPSSRRTSAAFSPGNTSARTSSMLSVRATASAVARLSPVRSRTRMPRSWSDETALFAVGECGRRLR